METKTGAERSAMLIDEVMEIYKKDIQQGNQPRFNELAKICREQNQIADEIRILKLAVSFYENSNIDQNEKLENLKKFKMALTARQKEAKVLELLDWTE